MTARKDKYIAQCSEHVENNTENYFKKVSEYPNADKIEFIDVLFPDINGIIRGKRLPRSLMKPLATGTYMPISLLAMDILGNTIEATNMGQETGEADYRCIPIPETLVPSADDPLKIAQIMLTMVNEDNTPVDIEPRNIVNKLWNQLKEKGVNPVIALEYEFYLVDNEFSKTGHVKPPLTPSTKRRDINTQCYSLDGLTDYSNFLNDIIEMAEKQNIPTIGALTEAAPGQFEINLNHSSDVLSACDHAVMLKRLIKEIAYEHNMQATFMAKPYGEHAGSGLHSHISFLDNDGNNLMQETDKVPNQFMNNVIAGMIDMMPECLALLAPNMNSYRRYQPGMYVPIKASWGFNNRTVALRIPLSSPKNLRVEYRLAGADANPYLLIATLFASVLHGLETKQDAPEPIVGNGFIQDGKNIPIYQSHALALLDKNGNLEKYFGEKFLNIYYTCKYDELMRFKSYVTSQEIRWLLDHA